MKKQTKPGPRRFTRDMAGCETRRWDSFRDRYYPNQNYIPVTEENFYLWCKADRCPQVAYRALQLTIWLTTPSDDGLRWRYIYGDSSGCDGVTQASVNPDIYTACCGKNDDLSILACIFALQAQGVFR